MPTESESTVTEISSNIFFREFTFSSNEFFPPDGQKELADHILWLDELLFIIQTKERNPKDVKNRQTENSWFKNTVLKKAKNQIKDSVSFFRSYGSIRIKNQQDHHLDVAGAYSQFSKKIIIYEPNSRLLDEGNRMVKFYESAEVGNIHIFHMEDYYNISKTLHTPTELDEYLSFRERIYLRHKSTISIWPEQYILAHFLNTDDETAIDASYIQSLPRLARDAADFDMSSIFSGFYEKIHPVAQKESRDYYHILKETAKLKRYELLEFKKRFTEMSDIVGREEFALPARFTNERTGCGFTFIALAGETEKWENYLFSITELYKYKRKLQKCVGVLMHKDGDFRNIYWAYLDSDWEYDKEMELQLAKLEHGNYGPGFIKRYDRYRFEGDSSNS